MRSADTKPGLIGYAAKGCVYGCCTRAPEWAQLLARPEELFVRAEFREVNNIARNRAGFLAAGAKTPERPGVKSPTKLPLVRNLFLRQTE